MPRESNRKSTAEGSGAETTPRANEVYDTTEDGGVELTSHADRWVVYDDHVDLSPEHAEGELLRWEAEKKPFVDDTDRGALVVIDVQNDFCAPGGWTDVSGLNYEGCREAIPGIERAIETAREYDMPVIWVYWNNRHDLRNLGAPTLYSFKHSPDQPGIGEESDGGRILLEDSWGAEIVEELQPHMNEEDIHVHKVRMSGFYGTHLEQVLRAQGIETLFFTGVNADQCVATTMQGAYFRDLNCVLLSDATATSSPDYCQKSVEFNAKQCWGFSMTTEQFANGERVDEA